MHPSARAETRPENVRTYLELTRLLDGIEEQHPEISAPLRLALQRARREGLISALDEGDFRAAVARTGTIGGQVPTGPR